jgi:hypothetical protein
LFGPVEKSVRGAGGYPGAQAPHFLHEEEGARCAKRETPERESAVNSPERDMSRHVWTRSQLVHAIAAFGLSVAMLSLDTAAYAFDPVTGTGRAIRMAEFSDESPIGTEDPTEDGSIIIECIVSRNKFDINTSRAKLLSVAMPQHPLGPSKCRPREHKRT